MKHYIKIAALLVFLFGIFQEGMAQSPCFSTQPVTGTYANKPNSTSTSLNKNRVFWLTWGSTFAESTTTHPYGHRDRALAVGSKSYGSIDLGGGRFMCIEAEIMTLTGGTISSYMPGTYNPNATGGDFLDILYNIGGSGGTNGNPENKMASGIINNNDGGTVNLTVRIKATTGGDPVRLRGIVVADAETLGSSTGNQSEYIRATGFGNWSVAEVLKRSGAGTYLMRKEDNTGAPSYPGTQSIIFDQGNDTRTGAVAFLTYNNIAYDPLQGNAVTLPIELKGAGKQAFAIGLLTSGYDFGDAPESYGKPIHLIDDIKLTSDGINPVIWNASAQTKTNSQVNVNAPLYNAGNLTYSVRRYLGSTPPDPDTLDMFSEDAKGDDNSGTAGANEEDAWPLLYRRFADKEYYKPGDKIIAIIPYKKALANDIISGWIDFDLNGTFDEIERKTAIIPSDGDGNVTLTWTIPSTRFAYSTYVRLRYFGRNQDATSPIGNTLNGEVEDHRIYILTPAVSNPTINSKGKGNN
ncbi:CshA/CshB family fibrillar adhesin-related protein [Bizionia myxarmorum]|uniref:Uncharacterized protein n=1 Tax=Bizionia myxarmorum TaxID=291186 RepID=A0A5D0R4F9_9FLAO|nr:CshA/CshB family fibrillar adhesin-related protein [Bizionia myxarmorum]TYB75855.1 hypothetical protein ES674_13625 [Bizionia myxarmorum]